MRKLNALHAFLLFILYSTISSASSDDEFAESSSNNGSRIVLKKPSPKAISSESLATAFSTEDYSFLTGQPEDDMDNVEIFENSPVIQAVFFTNRPEFKQQNFVQQENVAFEEPEKPIPHKPKLRKTQSLGIIELNHIKELRRKTSLGAPESPRKFSPRDLLSPLKLFGSLNSSPRGKDK